VCRRMFSFRVSTGRSEVTSNGPHSKVAPLSKPIEFWRATGSYLNVTPDPDAFSRLDSWHPQRSSILSGMVALKWCNDFSFEPQTRVFGYTPESGTEAAKGKNTQGSLVAEHVPSLAAVGITRILSAERWTWVGIFQSGVPVGNIEEVEYKRLQRLLSPPCTSRFGVNRRGRGRRPLAPRIVPSAEASCSSSRPNSACGRELLNFSVPMRFWRGTGLWERVFTIYCDTTRTPGRGSPPRPHFF